MTGTREPKGKGKGGLGGILDAIKAEVMEPEAPESADAPATAIPAPLPPLPIPSFSGTQSAPIAPTSQSAAVDPALLGEVSSKVFGMPSLYSSFKAMTNTLGVNTDPNTVLAALKVTSPDISPVRIIADIDTHMGVLQQTRQSAETQLAGQVQEKLSGTDTEIARLEAENRGAEQAIARMTGEIADRNTKVTGLKADRAVAEAAINAGRERFNRVAEVITTELSTARERLAVLK